MHWNCQSKCLCTCYKIFCAGISDGFCRQIQDTVPFWVLNTPALSPIMLDYLAVKEHSTMCGVGVCLCNLVWEWFTVGFSLAEVLSQNGFFSARFFPGVACGPTPPNAYPQ